MISASAKPCSTSPSSKRRWLAVFEVPSERVSLGTKRAAISVVRMCSCTCGAPSAIASWTLSTGSSGSYTTSISASASSAMCGSVAQMAATACPA